MTQQTTDQKGEWEEQVKNIQAAIFLSPPLDIHKIGDIRPKLEWQVKQIMELLTTARQQAIREFVEKIKGNNKGFHCEAEQFCEHTELPGYKLCLDDMQHLADEYLELEK